MMIRQYANEDRAQVIALWEECGLTRPWNNPGLDIDRKLADSPWGLLVLESDGAIVGSVMVGYDGHRGWINYLAAAPGLRRQGIGSALMSAAEALLASRGCPKVNLQVRDGNDQARAFHEQRGYSADDVTNYGLRIVQD